MASKRITGTAETYADDLATITTRNEYRDSMTMESTGEARPYMAIGRDEPVEALAELWFALHGEVAEDADDAEDVAEDAEDAIANEDVIAYIRRVGDSDVVYSAPIGGTETESRTWYDALATNWEHVARIGILERHTTEPNLTVRDLLDEDYKARLTVRDMARKDRAQGWINQNWRYGDHTMPIVWVGNPSQGIPMAVAPGRSGRGYERTGSRNWGNGAPIKNAETLAASIANGGQAVTRIARVAACRAEKTPEQRAIARAKDAAARKSKRNAAK
jgi:hypothetical protein